MIEVEGSLQTLAEVSVALAGFASLLLAVSLLLGYLSVLRLRRSILASGVEPSFPRFSRVVVHSPVALLVFLLALTVGALGSAAAGAYVLILLLLVALSSLPLLILVIDLAAASRS